MADILVPEFGDYRKSDTKTLGYDRSYTKDRVQSEIENTDDYQAYTNQMLQELRNNSQLAQEYTKQFHAARRKQYGDEYDEQGNYIGKQDPNTNERVKAQGIFDDNGNIDPDAWLRARRDGMKGLVHDFKLEQSPEPTITPTPTPTPTPYKNPFKSSWNLNFASQDRVPWTDYIPHTAQFVNALISNYKSARLQQQMRFPREQAPQKHAIVTDAYAERQLLEKQKQELLARADNTRVATQEQQNIIQQNAQWNADKYSDAQGQSQMRDYNTTTKEVNDVANWNMQQRVDTANVNAQATAAEWNNWLNAEKQRVVSDAAARKGYIYDMYNDFGKYKQNKRINKRMRDLAVMKLALSDRLGNIEQLASDLTDPNNWSVLPEYAMRIANDRRNPAGLTQTEIDIINQYHGNPEAVLEAIKRIPSLRNALVHRLLNSTDEVTKAYRSSWQEEVKRIERDSDNAAWDAHRKYAAAEASLPYSISNQIFDFPIYKKGGKLKLLKELARQRQKEQESTRKNSQEFHKRASKELSEQLGALNKEQLLLLKAIFK